MPVMLFKLVFKMLKRWRGPHLAFGLSCVRKVMKEPLLHEKHSAVVEGKASEKSPS